MKFKIVLKEQKMKLGVNMSVGGEEVFLPTNPEQSVVYPVPAFPKKPLLEFEGRMQALVQDEDVRVFQEISDDIRALQRKRTEKMNEIRARLNPEIIQVCESMREDYPEHFI